MVPKRWRLVPRPLQPPLPVVGFTPATHGWMSVSSRQVERVAVPSTMAECFPTARLIAFGLATRSPIALEALALQATRGQFSFDGLVALARAGHSGSLAPAHVVVAPRVEAFVGLVQVAASSGSDEEDVNGLLELAITHARQSAQADVLPLVFLLISLGRRRDAVELFPRADGGTLVTELAVADLLNPFVADDVASGATEAWLAAVNAAFWRVGLDPVALDDSRVGPALDRLTAQVDARTGEQGPLVSIIMSCFEPGDELAAAVRSVIAQTWQNWELLIVDDASGAQFDGVLDEVAAMDDRVTVSRASVNAGTYVRRNEALQRARGEFVTMHDSDDWAHPRRLEWQVRHLQASPQVVANTVNSLRVTDELLFTQPRGVRFHLAEPGLMFRREVVLQRIGFFDSVRRAADTEFRLRLERAFAFTVPVVAEGAPLFLMRYERLSLSGHDLADGWTHPSRFAYRSAHRLWRETAAGRRAPYMPFPLEERPFPAPDHMTGTARATRNVDVLLVLDGRRGTISRRSARRIAREVRSAAESGVTVALMHVQTPHHQWIGPELHPAIQQCISSGAAQQVLVGERVVARLLVARHASSVCGLPLVSAAAVDAERAIIIRDPEARLDVAGRTYSRAWCDDLLRAYAGCDPEWRDAGTGAVSLVDLIGRSRVSA